MSMTIIIITVIIVGYLLGSFPSAYLMGRIVKKIDIRQVGSKNMGAMNSMYNLGFGAGLLVLLMDAAKGALAIIFGLFFAEDLLIAYLCGFMAVIGHNFPVWLNFKGGKGGATVVGIVCYLCPLAILFAIVLFGILTWMTKWPTISYGIALLLFPLISLIIGQEAILTWGLLFFVLIPYIFYIPRLVQVYQGYNGDWKRIFKRKNLKDRK
ncbi:MAG: glycerol-3-phosphate acyltransferase [Chloroflexi bacterium]|nr:glycerol-3-phosphate acyltransferase [Chloroflexota bacterium]